MNKLQTSFFMLLLVLAYSCQPTCGSEYPEGMDLDHTNAQNVALDGLDVVTLYRDNKDLKGTNTLYSVHNGISYNFQTIENKKQFDRSPEKFMPQIGGYCVVAASMGKVEETDLKHFGVYEDKLYFATNQKAFDMWLKDKEGISSQAHIMWPCLVNEKGRTLK